jgi:membrane protein DedA with SNARE-associated domain
MDSVLVVFDQLWRWITDPVILHTYGYIGIFLTSFLGSLIVFVPVPYFLVVAAASADHMFDPTLIGVFSALGATAAKVIIFQASYTGSKLMSSNTEKRMKPFMKLVSRYGGVAAFLAAATPIPDDMIYIPLGLARYSLHRFVFATLSGKILLTVAISWGVRLSYESVRFLMDGSTDPFGAALIASGFIATIVGTVYAMMKLDWAKILGRWFPWTVEPDS